MTHGPADALERFLARLLLRSPLSDDEMSAILALEGKLVRLGAHRDVVRLREKTSFACLVVDGLAGRFDQPANGDRQITALHIPGDMCDLHSVAVPFTGWGIQALTTSTYLHISHSALKDLTLRYPRIAYAFWRDTIADASILAKWISALGRRSAKQRLAHLLCEVGIRMEQASLGTRSEFDLPATQTQLADVLGITAVHLNRSIQSLRADGLMNMNGGHVEVLDVERLSAVAEFDPAYLLLEVEGGSGLGVTRERVAPISA